MGILKVTTKGQVTLRKDILKHLGVEPGARISVDLLPDGRITARAERSAGDISEAFGYLKLRGRTPLSLAKMKKVAADGWAGKR